MKKTCYKAKSTGCPSGYYSGEPNTSYFKKTDTQKASDGTTCYKVSCNTDNGASNGKSYTNAWIYTEETYGTTTCYKPDSCLYNFKYSALDANNKQCSTGSISEMLTFVSVEITGRGTCYWIPIETCNSSNNFLTDQPTGKAYAKYTVYQTKRTDGSTKEYYCYKTGNCSTNGSSCYYTVGVSNIVAQVRDKVNDVNYKDATVTQFGDTYNFSGGAFFKILLNGAYGAPNSYCTTSAPEKMIASVDCGNGTIKEAEVSHTTGSNSWSFSYDMESTYPDCKITIKAKNGSLDVGNHTYTVHVSY
jgi:hypothetical protein